jgi:hypothetical protein
MTTPVSEMAHRQPHGSTVIPTDNDLLTVIKSAADFIRDGKVEKAEIILRRAYIDHR